MLPFLILAKHNKSFETHTRLSNLVDNTTKLDVYQRNTYNRTNHNRHNPSASTQSHQINPQIIVDDIVQHDHQQPHISSSLAHHQQSHHNPNHQYHHQTQSQHHSVAYDRYPNDLEPYWDETGTDSRRFTERRKKTVRFDGQEQQDDLDRWDTERQGSQDSATKDSGIETSSTFTSSEDSNRGDGLKVPLNKTKKKKTKSILTIKLNPRVNCHNFLFP